MAGYLYPSYGGSISATATKTTTAIRDVVQKLSLINDGPDTVYVRKNDSACNAGGASDITIKKDELFTFELGPCNIFTVICDAGNTAVVRWAAEKGII